MGKFIVFYVMKSILPEKRLVRVKNYPNGKGQACLQEFVLKVSPDYISKDIGISNDKNALHQNIYCSSSGSFGKTPKSSAIFSFLK